MAQYTKKNISDNAIGATKIALENNLPLKADNALKDGFVEIVKVNDSDQIEFLDIPFLPEADATESNQAIKLSQLESTEQQLSAVDTDLQDQIDENLVYSQAIRVDLDDLVVTSTQTDTALSASIDALDVYAQEVRADLDALDVYAQEIRSDLDQEIVNSNSAIAAETSAREDADNALQSNIDAEASDRENADNDLQGQITQEISDRQTADLNIQSQITALQGASDVLFEDDANVYADATAPIEDPTGRDGWYYKSAGSPDKVNWYFHDGQANPVTVGQWERLYTVATVDSSSNDTFHLAYYTFPLGDGQDAGSWYRSRIVYVPSGNFERGVKTLFYMGQEPDASVYPDLPRVQMTVTTVAGSNVGLNENTEVIMTTVFGTNSTASAGSVEILVNKLGFNSSVYNKEYSLEIRGEFTLAGIKQSLLEEAIARQNADSELQDNIDIEKARIDAILSASDADKDSFAEIVSLINSVDTENDQAFASYVTSNNNRVSLVETDVDTLQSGLASEITSREALESEYDQYVINNDARILTAENTLDQEILDRESADSALQSDIDTLDVYAQEIRSDLDSLDVYTQEIRTDLDNEIAERISEVESSLVEAKAYTDQEILVEKTRAESAESLLESDIDNIIQGSGLSTEGLYVANSLTNYISEVNSLAEADETLDAKIKINEDAISAEALSRSNADAILQSNIDAVQADVNQNETSFNIAIANLRGADNVLFEDSTSVYADGTAAIEDPSGRDGWYYKSAGSPDKINWYFHDGTATPITVGQWENLYTVATVDSSSNDTFHLSYYTIPQGDGNDAGSWYRSRIVYVPQNGFARGVKTLFYMGQEPDASLYPDLPRVQMIESTVAGSSIGPNEDSESILTVVFGTNSAATAGSVELLVNKLGIQSSVFSAEYSLEIRGEFTLSGIKQSIFEEASARQAADVQLQSNIDVEKSRIDAILEASEADKDSFAEIVQLINSVDTENDAAFAGYVLSNDLAVSSLDDRATALESGLSSETTNRQNADQALQDDLDSLDVYAQETRSDLDALDVYSQEIRTDVDTEIQNRISADNNLQSQVDTLSGNLTSSEASLISLINDETSAREQADTAIYQEISNQIGNVLSNIDPDLIDSFTEVVTAFQAADQNLNNAISALGLNASSALASESSRAQAAETDLQNQITTEINRATGAENTIAQNLANETLNREAAVTAEEQARIAADANLQNQINNIISNTDPDAIDSFTEVVAAFAQADQNLNSAITTLANAASTDLQAESTRAQTVETDLQDQINNLSDTVSADVTVFEQRLTTLEADPVTKTYVDGEVDTLQNQINFITSNADPAVLDSLTEVVAAFQAADSDLQNAISILTFGISGQISAEQTARITAINALDVRVTSLENTIVNKISSDTTGIGGADQITNMVSLTQAEYDAIPTKSASTFYIITDAV